MKQTKQKQNKSHEVPSFYLGYQFSCQNKFHKHKKTLLLLLFYISPVLTFLDLNWGQNDPRE